MAIRTSSQNGNWNLTATWGGAAVPGNGDQVVVNHQVTVSDARIIGLSEAETSTNYAIQTNGNGGRLIIASGGILQVRGNARMTGLAGGGGDIEVQGGGIWEFDSSQALDPTNQNYHCIVGTSSVEINCAFRVTGTSAANRGTIRSNASGGNGYFDKSGVYNCGCHDWNWFFALRIGTAIIRAVETDSLSSENAEFDFQNGDFEACGGVRTTGANAGVPLRVINCRFYGSIAGTSNLHLASVNGVQTGVRNISDNSFDAAAVIPHLDLTCENNFFGGGYDTVNAGRKFASFTNNLIRFTNDIKRFHDGSQDYWVVDGSTWNSTNGTYSATADVNNPHWHSADSNSLSATYRETNSIYEDFGSTGDGDIQYPSATSGVHNEFYYCLVLPSQSRSGGNALNAGTMATVNGATGHANHFVHCTHFGGGQGFLSLAEGGTGFTGMIAQCHSNLCWNSSNYSAAGFNYIADDYTGGSNAADMITAANCKNNCHWGIRTDGVQGAYDISSSGTLGVGDINQNPQFAGISDINDAATYKHFYHWVKEITGNTIPGNPTPTNRDFNAWGLYLLSLRNRSTHADFNASATLANWKTWIRDKYRPTNETLRNAGLDGVTIGAVEMVQSSNVTLVPIHINLDLRASAVSAGAIVALTPVDPWLIVRAPGITGDSVVRAAAVQVDIAPRAIVAGTLMPIVPVLLDIQLRSQGVAGGAVVTATPTSINLLLHQVFGGPPLTLVPILLNLEPRAGTLSAGAVVRSAPVQIHFTPSVFEQDKISVVQFPGIRESFQRAMYEFLSKYMDGETHTVATQPLELYDCNVFFDINKLKEQPLPKPTIVIAGSRISGHEEKKCLDPSGQKDFGYEVRTNIIRSVYVAVSTGNSYPKQPFGSSQTQPGDLLLATEVWDQVFAVVTSKPAELHERRIFKSVLTPISVQVPDDSLTILYGTLSCEVRAPYARD